MNITAYHRPELIDECLGLLTQSQGEARLISGGTDLMLDIESRRKTPKVLVDTAQIKGFDAIDINAETITIHGGVTHTMVRRHEGLSGMVPALAQACGSVGSPQIRNVATLAGNVVNAQPAADSAIALIGLDAKAVICRPGQTREESVESLFLAPGKSGVDSTSEILSAFVFDTPGKFQSCAYGRISPRNSLCLPIVNTAVNITLDGSGKISAAKIVIAPVAKTPLVVQEARDILMGQDADNPGLYEQAAAAASRAANPRSSCLRGCSDYRKQLVYVLTRRIIARAVQDAITKFKGV